MTTNHNPTITSAAATGSFSEDANTTGSTVDHVLTGTMNFTDSDHSDTHTTTAALKTAVWSGGSTLPTGALTKFQAGLTSSIVSDSNGSGKLKWTFSEDDRDFDFLAKGETIVLTYEITLKDNHGGSTKQTVKMTVTGTDDKPVFATATGATLSEQTNHSLSLSPDTAHIALQFTDVDLNNTGHTACVLSVSATGNTSGILPGSFGTAELMSFFDIDNVVKNAGSSNGVVNTTFSAPDLAFDYLAAGEQIQITYVVQVDDKKGGLSTQNVTVTVNGTNDKPVVLAFPESAHLTEDHNLTGGNLTAHGDFLFSDLDLSDTHTVSTTVTATRSGGGAVPISNADLIDAMGALIDPDSTSHVLGEVDWNFALPNSAVDFLAEGETLTLKYQITVTDPSGASDTEEVCITVLGINKPVVTKTATVPGGTADVAGEVIHYDIAVANSGHSDLTGITVTDPSVSNLAPVVSGGFNSGDTNHDNKLSAGETWHYTASYTVTQNDINTLGGGDGFIENTVSVDTAETLPVTATAAVVVESGASVDLTKTANVASVNAAGNVVTYSITVANDGNTALTNPFVEDSNVNIVSPIYDLNAPILGPALLAPVLNGDYNVGDVGTPGHPELAQNGVQDPGETFQFKNAGDENNNGIEDNGETFLFTNIGDTNQNGGQDTGETFSYYNAGDTNHDGVEDGGETFQFQVSHAATYVSGDTNNNGEIDLGETWHYTVSYTVTQDDIDNGGVVNPALTHDNTATVTTGQGASDSDSVSVLVVQDPRVSLAKSASVADGTANAVGDVINYTIDVSNAGNMTLTGINVTDPSVTGLTYVSGDTDGDDKLDLTETWHYTAHHTVTQADIDNGGVVNAALTYTNTASVTTDQGSADADANDSDSVSVAVVQDPHVSLTKSAVVADGTADSAGDVINYTINVANTGNMTLTGAAVTDPSVSNLTRVADLVGNNDNILNVGETWQYTANHAVTQADIDNGGVFNAALTYNNTASVTTAQGVADADANDSDTASVPIVQSPSIALDKTATVPGGTADTAGEVISYTINVSNTGNMTLTGVNVSDPSVGDLAAVESGGFNAGDTNHDGKLDLTETWQYTASHTVTQAELDNNGGGDGTIDNTASVTTTQGATANDTTHVTVVPTPVAPLTIDDNFNLSHLVDVGPAGPDAGGDLIQFFFTVTNHTSGTFTSFTVTDTLGDIPGSLQNPVPSSLAGNSVYSSTYNHFLTAADITNGFVDDDVTTTGIDPSTVSQMATLHFHFLL
jgi:uncharacterized repeat protein (TIGR01451 family)